MFYEELELKQVFDKFRKYHMEILLGDITDSLGHLLMERRTKKLTIF
jgi:hypothetical protein